MVLVVREFVRTRDPLIRDPLNTYTLLEYQNMFVQHFI